MEKRSLNILIVEDQAEKTALLKIGIMETFQSPSILIKNSLPDAEEALRQNSFDLILLDGDLNGHHGEDLIPVIRQTQQDCVIAACSDREQKNKEMMEAGADIVTEKDFANVQFADIRKKLFELVMKTTTA